MFSRVMAFIRDLAPPDGDTGRQGGDEPQVAAAALLVHVMNADGVRKDAELRRVREMLAASYGVSGNALDRLAAAGEAADSEAVDLYAFTSVLGRHLDAKGRIEFIRIMWEIVFADGELHELEDNTVWRVAELLGVERRDRVAARKSVRERLLHIATGPDTDD